MSARLSLEEGTATPAHWELRDEKPISLGRGLDNTIVLKDKCASKRHAEIFLSLGRWYVRDLASRNGVTVNGRRVQSEAELPPDARIVLGDVCFRFTTDAAQEGTDEIPAVVVRDDADETSLHPDELTALYQFLADSLRESGPHGLVQLALSALLRQTRADFVGFRSLDADDLLIVLPEQARVDARLSSRMTQKALTTSRTVWLANPDDSDLTGESLAGFRDALCVPLCDHPPHPNPPPRGGREPRSPSPLVEEGWGGGAESPPGALHVYRHSRPFAERDVHFCEVLARCLAGCLRGVRDRRALSADNSRLRLGSPGGDDALIGDGPAMDRLREQIAKLADYPGTVLITGETGVGKELAALGLHRASRRREEPLVTVNCASLNPNTAVAELFGHDERAFTGAEGAHAGFFQQAEGGALFLDEIGELTLETQGMLLRALESRSVRPLMGKKDVKVDVRVLAATNRDLELEVQRGRFRKDLFFRLTVSIKVPPLREHAEDVPALAGHFLANLRKSDPRPLSLTPVALERLQAYSWPGNVRQLRYILEGAAALSRDGEIDAADLHLTAGAVDDGAAIPLNLEELEAWAIRRALDQSGDNKTRAAEVLGIHRDTLIAKIKKYHLARRM